MTAKPVITVTMNPAIDQVIELDHFIIGSMNRAKSSTPMLGGKGINVARVLAGFGVPVITTGFFGENSRDFLQSVLKSEGIENAFQYVSGEVRVNLKIHDAASGYTSEINQPGFSVSKKQWNLFLQTMSNLLDQASALVLTGSIPDGVPNNAYYLLTKMAAEKHIPVFLDADGQNLQFGLQGKPFCVKPNRDELELFAGRTLATEQELIMAMIEFRNYGVSLIASTMGAQGILMLNDSTVWKIDALPITPACATGAGDSVFAAMVYAWLNQFSIQETLAWMSAAGGITTSKHGVVFCTKEEVESAVPSLKAYQVYGYK